MRYQAKFNKQAKQWDVIDTISSEIVAMLEGGKRGESDAKRMAHNYNLAAKERYMSKLPKIYEHIESKQVGCVEQFMRATKRPEGYFDPRMDKEIEMGYPQGTGEKITYSKEQVEEFIAKKILVEVKDNGLFYEEVGVDKEYFVMTFTHVKTKKEALKRFPWAKVIVRGKNQMTNESGWEVWGSKKYYEESKKRKEEEAALFRDTGLIIDEEGEG